MMPAISIIRSILILGITLLLLSESIGQDLNNLGDKPPVALSGSIAAGFSFYEALESESRRSPYGYFISANPTISIYGFDIPISFVYRDQKGSISTPFNQLSISPTYKWATVHVGGVTMPLSPYTLSGQIVNGVGAEFKPGKFRFSGIYGKLENPLAQVDTIVTGATLLKTYDREAIGAKLGFDSKAFDLALIGFRAKDDPESQRLTNEEKRLIRPEENIVLGTELKIVPVKQVSLYVNVAASAHTANQNAVDVLDDELKADLQPFQDVMTLNLSSKFQLAGDAGIDFRFKGVGFGLKYKRVDPLYKSLGTYYFQEDYENYTGNITFSLLRSKVRISARGGIQQNNLNGLRSQTSKRTIGNVNVSINPAKQFLIVARYSNFQTDRTPSFTNVNDSLRLTRTSGLYGVTTRYGFGKGAANSSITASFNYQNLEDLQNDRATPRGIDNYTGNVSYGIRWKEKNLNITLSGLFNQNEILAQTNRRIGGNLRILKKFFEKKLNTNVSMGYFINTLNDVDNGNTMTARVGVGYRVKKKYTLSMNVNYLNRKTEQRPSEEIRGAFKVSYFFNTK